MREKPHQYLARNFLNYNSGILMSMRRQVLNTSETLAALAHRAATGDVSCFDDLVDEFQVVTSRPVVFIIDEHNEIYKVQKQATAFFRPFTIATGVLSGVRHVSSSDPVYVLTHYF